jgi:hypothetical protein
MLKFKGYKINLRARIAGLVGITMFLLLFYRVSTGPHYNSVDPAASPTFLGELNWYIALLPQQLTYCVYGYLITSVYFIVPRLMPLILVALALLAIFAFSTIWTITLLCVILMLWICIISLFKNPYLLSNPRNPLVMCDNTPGILPIDVEGLASSGSLFKEV